MGDRLGILGVATIFLFSPSLLLKLRIGVYAFNRPISEISHLFYNSFAGVAVL